LRNFKLSQGLQGKCYSAKAIKIIAKEKEVEEFNQVLVD
jgi:hypothetical protein